MRQILSIFLLALVGCANSPSGATDAALARTYTYVLVDTGYRLELRRDHTYVFASYAPFAIQEGGTAPVPPLPSGKWERRGRSVRLTSAQGQVRQLEVMEQEGRGVLKERRTPTVVWTYR